MIFITSPAKTQDFKTDWVSIHSQPIFLKECSLVMNVLKRFDVRQIEDYLGVSKKLAMQNYDRFKYWDLEHGLDKSKPAILAYKGDIYKQFDASKFDSSEQKYLQDHLRIITGLYGVLRPYDLIRPYRLEMKTKLPVNGKKDLYTYWSDKITNYFKSEIEKHPYTDRYLINLASNEYSIVINKKKLNARWIDIEFRQIKEGEEKNIGIFSKQARGLFIKFLTDNMIKDYNSLRNFKEQDYRFDREEDNKLYFVRDYRVK